MNNQNDSDVENFLAHYGVKGMKWGVINEDRPIGDNRSKTVTPNSPVKLSKLEQDVLKKANTSGMTEDRMRRLYGPEEKKEPRKLTDAQKDVLKKTAIIAAGVGALYLLNQHASNKFLERELGDAADSAAMVKFWKDHQLGVARGPFQPGRHPENMSTKGVLLQAGSILQRVSTDQELNIHPGGFYAAYKPEDVQRYKAALPVYWKMWGLDAKEGFVVNLKAKEAIKAPSPKETFDMFQTFLNSPETGKNVPAGRLWRDNYDWGIKNDTTETVAKASWGIFTNRWNDKEDKVNQAFFAMVKEKGFNALIDINDAGSLGDAPLRILDGTMFEHAGADKLSQVDIKSAQRALTRLKHMIEEVLMDEEVEDFLAHFGVKGMKWGVHNTRPGGVSRRTDREAKKDAVESARAKMFYGQGAGTRRKLINESVAAKSKRDPGYAEAFSKHLADQNMSTHAEKARSERSSADRKDRNVKRAGYVARRLTGEMGTQAAFTAAVIGGAAFLNSPKGRSAMSKTAKSISKTIANQRNSDLVNFLNDYLSNQ